MVGSKRSAKRNWLRGRGPYSYRGEIKTSLKVNKNYLNRKVRRAKNLGSGGDYKKLAKERAFDLLS